MVGAWDTITKAVGSAISWISQNWPMLLAILSGPIGTAVYLIVRNWETIKQAFANAWSYVTGLWGQATGFFVGIFNSIAGAFAGMPNVGRNLVQGLWNGINDMAGWIKGKIEGFGKGVLDNLKNFFGIHSPSRVMRDQIGNMIGLGVGDGIMKSLDQVLSDVGSFSDQIITAMDVSVSGDMSMSNITTSADDIWGDPSQGATSPQITQNVYPQTPIDMNIINRSLIREARRA